MHSGRVFYRIDQCDWGIHIFCQSIHTGRLQWPAHAFAASRFGIVGNRCSIFWITILMFIHSFDDLGPHWKMANWPGPDVQITPSKYWIKSFDSTRTFWSKFAVAFLSFSILNFRWIPGSSIVDKVNVLFREIKYVIFFFGLIILCTALFQLQEVSLLPIWLMWAHFAQRLLSAISIFIFRKCWTAVRSPFSVWPCARAMSLYCSFIARAASWLQTPATYRMRFTNCAGTIMIKTSNIPYKPWSREPKNLINSHRARPSIVHCRRLHRRVQQPPTIGKWCEVMKFIPFFFQIVQKAASAFAMLRSIWIYSLPPTASKAFPIRILQKAMWKHATRGRKWLFPQLGAHDIRSAYLVFATW